MVGLGLVLHHHLQFKILKLQPKNISSDYKWIDTYLEELALFTLSADKDPILKFKVLEAVVFHR